MVLLLAALAQAEPRWVFAKAEAPAHWDLGAPPADMMLTYTITMPSRGYACRGYATGPGVQHEKVEAQAWADVHRCLVTLGEARGLKGLDLENWFLNQLPPTCTVSEATSTFWGPEALSQLVRERTYTC